MVVCIPDMDHGSVGNNEMNPLQERLYYGYQTLMKILYIMFLVLISYTAIGSVVELKTAAWIRAQGGNG